MIKDSEAYQIIRDRLIEQPEFSEFNWNKREGAFFRKTDFGFQSIALNGKGGFDLDNNSLAFEIGPYYSVRFDKIHEWYEPFSHKKKSDLRYSSTETFLHTDTGEFNSPILFRTESTKDFEYDIESKLGQVKKVSEQIFNKYDSLLPLYDLLIEPLEDKGKDILPDIGVDWVFRRLAILKSVRPSKFEELERVIYSRFEEMYNDDEPNVLMYYHKYPEILNALKSIDLR